MTRRATLLWSGTAATLLLGAWVSGSGPVGVFQPQHFSGRESSAPGQDFGPTDNAAGGGEKGHAGTATAPDTLAAAITWAMRVLIALVVIAVVVVLARAALDWLAGRRLVVEDEVGVEVLPEELLEQARESEQLLSRGTPANAVVAAWVRLEDAVRGAGLRDDDSRTSTELVTSVIRGLGVRQAPLDQLAALYREARFSRHPVGEDARARAGAALREIQADLRHVTRTPIGARTTARGGR
ncbi:MAG TPA: DUF4129 domain-containing protein [Pedococcus sp.]|nr:DUF4129 domain-containing protein [Pedococcus sp.]